MDMNGPSFEQDSPSHRCSSRLQPLLMHGLLPLGCVSMACREMEGRASGAPDACSFRFAQPHSRLGKRIEHALQVECRAANDLEHVGGGRLLLQRFAQLVEQASILDGYDGLGGEILDQIYLLIVEGADLLAIDSDRTNQVV